MMLGNHQRFWRIFGCSMLLHAALFAIMQSPWRKAVKPLPAIVASLRPVAEAAAPSLPAPQAAPATARGEPRTKRNPVATPPKKVLAVPRTSQEAPVLAVPPTRNEVASAMPAPSAVTAAAVVEPVAAPAARAQRPPADALASYRQRLSELFAGRQAYPRVAAMRGWEGEVRVRLKVARKGNLVSIALDHSSGFEVLDQNALAMVEGIAALPEFPDSLGDGEIQIVVPISYKLRKTT